MKEDSQNCVQCGRNKEKSLLEVVGNIFRGVDGMSFIVIMFLSYSYYLLIKPFCLCLEFLYTAPLAP